MTKTKVRSLVLEKAELWFNRKPTGYEHDIIGAVLSAALEGVRAHLAEHERTGRRTFENPQYSFGDGKRTTITRSE